jgi:hypothetical protein
MRFVALKNGNLDAVVAALGKVIEHRNWRGVTWLVHKRRFIPISNGGFSRDEKNCNAVRPMGDAFSDRMRVVNKQRAVTHKEDARADEA